MVQVGRRFEVAGSGGGGEPLPSWRHSRPANSENCSRTTWPRQRACPKEGPTAQIPTMAKAFLESIPPELTRAAASKDRAAASAAAFQHAATMCSTPATCRQRRHSSRFHPFPDNPCQCLTPSRLPLGRTDKSTGANARLHVPRRFSLASSSAESSSGPSRHPSVATSRSRHRTSCSLSCNRHSSHCELTRLGQFRVAGLFSLAGRTEAPTVAAFPLCRTPSTHTAAATSRRSFGSYAPTFSLWVPDANESLGSRSAGSASGRPGSWGKCVASMLRSTEMSLRFMP